MKMMQHTGRKEMWNTIHQDKSKRMIDFKDIQFLVEIIDNLYFLNFIKYINVYQEMAE